MLVTTLGYMEKDGCWLMLHRTKKKNDINQDKWIGIGGKLEDGESVLECMVRETREETGLTWLDPTLKGIITFNFRKHPEDPLFSELMFLFHGRHFEGKLKECAEGQLEWVNISQVSSLPLWPGDHLFLQEMRTNPHLFYMRLDYLGDHLVYASLNERVLIDEGKR